MLSKNLNFFLGHSLTHSILTRRVAEWFTFTSGSCYDCLNIFEITCDDWRSTAHRLSEASFHFSSSLLTLSTRFSFRMHSISGSSKKRETSIRVCVIFSQFSGHFITRWLVLIAKSFLYSLDGHLKHRTVRTKPEQSLFWTWLSQTKHFHPFKRIVSISVCRSYLTFFTWLASNIWLWGLGGQFLLNWAWPRGGAPLTWLDLTPGVL